MRPLRCRAAGHGATVTRPGEHGRAPLPRVVLSCDCLGTARAPNLAGRTRLVGGFSRGRRLGEVLVSSAVPMRKPVVAAVLADLAEECPAIAEEGVSSADVLAA